MNVRTQLLSSLIAAMGILVLAGCNSSNAESEAAEHLQRAQVYSDQGQYRSALIEIRNATQKDPGNVEHAVSLAEVYLTVGASTFAVETLQPWRGEADQEIALPLAEAFILQGKYVSAREVLSAYSPQSDAERARRDVILADAERLAGNRAAAAQAYQTVLNSDPANVKAARGLANNWVRAGQRAEAQQFINEWMSNHEQDAELYYLLGLTHYDNNQLELASDTLTQGLEYLPTSDTFLPIRRQMLSLLSRTSTELGQMTQAQIYNQILAENTNQDLQQGTEAALSAIAEGDLATARSTLETLIRQNPDNNLIGMLLGAVSLQEGDLETGESLLSESIDAEITPTPFIQLSTMAQVDRGKREQAMTTLERALLARPTDVELLAMHGVLALAEPSTTAAGVSSLAKALEIDNSRSRLRLALAQHHLREGQTEQALGQLRAAFAQNPTDWPVTDFYLSTLLQNDQTSEVRELRSTLENQHSNQDFAQLLIGLADFSLGEPESAINRLERLVATTANANWDMPHNALARMYERQGNRSSAIDAYLRAAAINTQVMQPLQQATRLYEADRGVEATFEWLNSVATNNPELAANAHAIAASAHAQRGEFQRARTLLNQHDVQDNPFLVNAKGQLLVAEGQSAAQASDWTTARARLAEAVSLDPTNIGHHLLLVRVVAASGQTGEARTLLDGVIDDFGTQPPVAVVNAQLIEQEQNTEAAYSYLSARWQNNPNPGIAPEMVRLASRAARGDLISIAQQWTDIQPNNTQAWLTMGDTYLSQGDENSAEQPYREVLRIQPNNLIALNNLAWVLRERQSTEAVQLARRAAELAPDNAAILDTYGVVLFRAGELNEANAVLERALEIDPDNPDIQANKAQVQSALQ